LWEHKDTSSFSKACFRSNIYYLEFGDIRPPVSIVSAGSGGLALMCDVLQSQAH
jgi:hypothetical protein